MKHTRTNTMSVYSELVNRAMLAARLGTSTYEGNRDIYQALGYPLLVSFQDFLTKYVRHDIAKAVIDRPVRAAWRGGFTLQEKGKKGMPSKIEEEWKNLSEDLKLHTIFMRADKLTGLGRYGVLLLGFNDVTKLEDLANPVTGKSNKLLYVKPLGEESATIATNETNTRNKRYGMPLTYTVKISDSINTSQYATVHHTRIVHVAENLLENEYIGTPRLEAIYNRLLDLEKIIGGDAEMYWRGARPGYAGKVDKDFTTTPTSEKAIQDHFDEYENNLRRFLLMEGVDIKELAQQIADPSKNVDVQVQMISAVTGIPKRILMGSERGELSSSQDREEWNLWVQARREEFMEPAMVRPFVDRLMEFGALPKVDRYVISWDELFAMSPKEKAEIAEKIANAIRYYTATPAAEYILPKQVFLKRLLGLNEEELSEVDRLVEDMPELEPLITPEEQAALDGQTSVGAPIKRTRNPMNGTGVDRVAKKQIATV